jgi:hypothetical protein
MKNLFNILIPIHGDNLLTTNFMDYRFGILQIIFNGGGIPLLKVIVNILSFSRKVFPIVEKKHLMSSYVQICTIH